MSQPCNVKNAERSNKDQEMTVKRIYLLSFVAFTLVSQTFAEDRPPLQVGAASTVINNRTGGWVQGAGVPRTATKQRDDLEANALYLSDGRTKLLLVSCDLVGLNSGHVVTMREAMGEATGIPPRNILITCTHTHGGPSLLKTNYLMPIDHDYLSRLKDWLVEVATQSVQSARPGRVGWGKGTAQIGFNRRLCWADGTHSMYGDASRDDFVGLEGPDDPQHLAIFVADTNEKLIAVLHHNTTHVASFYAAGIYTAEFPGEARRILRKQLGEIPVLFLSGAQGDIAIPNVLDRRKESREQQLQRIGRMVADETLRLYENVTYHDHPALGHTHEDLKVAVRLPEPERLTEARKVLARIDAGEKIRGMGMIMAFGAVQLQKVYGENPTDTLPIHALRIGDVALVTQPCELYCQFGLDIKRRSPAPITAVVGLADGYGGYCPTIYGILGGGYSGQPIYWTRLESNAGYRIVESGGRLLNRIWQPQPENPAHDQE
jgi:neutral ceramidase